MNERRVVLVDGSRLVRDLLKRTLEKTQEFKVVQELNSWEGLSAILHQEDADWLFIVIPPGENVPEVLTTQLLMSRPTLRIVAFWMDGSHVKTEWLGRQERDFTGVSLQQISSLIQKELWNNTSNSPD